MTEWNTIETTVSGRRVVADRLGTGLSVLLIHGIPGWRGTWHATGSILSGSHDVVVPDLLGFGSSDAPAGDGHAAEQAQALQQLVDALDIDRVHVAGFDFGGPVAVSLLRRIPDRIASLTLIATNVFVDTPIPLPLKIARCRGLGDAAFRVFMGRAGLSMMWVAAVRNRRAFPFSRYRQALASPSDVRSTRAIFLNSLRNLESLYAPIQATLPDVGVPTSVIWGDADPFFPTDVGRRTAAAIPGAGYVELARCGHFVPEEYPDATARIIAATVRTALSGLPGTHRESTR